jgi:hypothetical protein
VTIVRDSDVLASLVNEHYLPASSATEAGGLRSPGYALPRFYRVGLEGRAPEHRAVPRWVVGFEG